MPEQSWPVNITPPVSTQPIFVHASSQAVVSKASTWPFGLNPVDRVTVDDVKTLDGRPPGRTRLSAGW
jgi:hypothetical protein